jgi:hypothetical protein
VASSGLFTDDALGRSTLAEIQRKIIKKGKRNMVSRLLHAKKDREMITAWKSDLTKILLVFNVRSVAVVRLLLTIHFQTEFALNTQTIFREGVNGTNTSVSIICILSITGRTLTSA